MPSFAEIIRDLKQPGYLTPELRRQLLDVLANPQPPPMTYEDFLQWLDEDVRAEWIYGEVIMMTPAGYRHQDICDFLIILLRSFIEVHGLGRVVSAPFQMKLANSGREPDLLFISAPHLDRLKTTYLDGPADLVVEIISPESIGRDRGEKFYEYEQAGIPEYWLIDPLREEAEFYQLDPKGRYRLTLPDAAGIYHSQKLPGLPLRITWLWQPPPVLQALQEVGLIPNP
jgi:Uma2 family endonuclease